MIVLYEGSKLSWLVRRRGRGMRRSCRSGQRYSEGKVDSMLAKVMGTRSESRFPIRNRVQVLPDLGYETRNRSSGKSVTPRPALILPNSTRVECARCLRILDIKA